MGEREEYYDRRAAGYDESITGGLQAETAAAFAQEMAELGLVLAALPPARVLDMACGTALFTWYLRGQVVALDQSAGMLKVARGRIPTAQLVQAAVQALPFARTAFDPVGRLPLLRSSGRGGAGGVCGRGAPGRAELVVIDTAASDTAAPDRWQERVLHNGSRYTIYKRHFTSAQLLAELGGDGEVGVSVHAATEQASCPLDWRLFLPEEWDADAQRRRKAHVPDEVHHRPKWQLALDMLDELAAWELAAPVLLADAAYGEVGQFRLGLEERELAYLVQVPGTLSAYPQDVAPETVPYAGRGRPLPPAALVAARAGAGRR